MRSYTECIPCFVRQAHDALEQTTKDEALAHRALRRVLRAAADFPLDETPPAMAQTIHRIVREETGNPDPYAEIKAESTRVALGLAAEARGIIDEAADPLAMATRFSIAGNIMDFAIMANWRKLDVANFIEQTCGQALDAAEVDAFRAAVEEAETILFLGDNAGEAVFDKLLIERFGDKKVFYAVKGGPIINDVTMKDALESGLDAVATLVENGSDAPGTILADCSEELRGLYESADLVVAKGQANYETLSDAAREVFFLTRVKCPVIGRDIDEPVGAWVVKQHLVEGRNVESPRPETFDLGLSDLGPKGVLS